MSNEEALTRREMKEPDKFQATATRAVEWVTGHKRNARTITAVLAGAVVLALLATWALRARDEKAGALAYEVVRVVGGEVGSSALPGRTGPVYATDAERQKAVIVEADRVLGEYPSTAAGRLALLMKADAQLKLGDADGAIASYERYLGATSSADSLRFGALEGIALALEVKGKAAEAAAAWERAGRDAPGHADRADLERARLLAASGKADEARKLLDGFEGRHKGTTLAGEAADRLARLGAK
jgi:tetratricopeptide (TPR) repeat protein